MESKQFVFKNNQVLVANACDKMRARGSLSTGTVNFQPGGYTETFDPAPQVFEEADGFAPAIPVRWEFKKIKGSDVVAKIVVKEWCDYREGFQAAERLLWSHTKSFYCSLRQIQVYKVFKINRKLWATPDGIMPLKKWFEIKNKSKRWIYSQLHQTIIQQVSSLEEVGEFYVSRDEFEHKSVCKIVLDKMVRVGESRKYSWQVVNIESLLKAFGILYLFDEPGWSRSDR